jgi:hypothetical protein
MVKEGNRFTGQDSSSCRTCLGERDLERTRREEAAAAVVETERMELREVLREETDSASAEIELVEAEKSELQEVFQEEIRSGEEALEAEDRNRRAVFAVATLATPQGLETSQGSCWSCDGRYVEVVRSSPWICLAIAEGCLQATDVTVPVHGV